MPFYDDTPNPDVLQREWAEAEQAAKQALATFDRAQTELRNAETNYEAAKSKADKLGEDYLAARGGVAAPAEAPKAKAAPAKGI